MGRSFTTPLIALFLLAGALGGRAMSFEGVIQPSAVPSMMTTGIPSSPSWMTQGDQAADEFGWVVASAGDVNGDGFSDVIVGAPFYNVGPQYDKGRAFLYLGSSNGLSTIPAWLGEGEQELEEFGFSVASAGDVNGDGYSDVLIGVPGHDGSYGYDAGRILLYLGSASGLSPSPSWAADGYQPAAKFGYSVASAGDVNGDGFSDIIVGSPYFKICVEYPYHICTVGGRVSVYLGSASGPGLSADWVADGLGQFGFSVAAAGDVNGDHFDDVIIGAHFHSAGSDPTSKEGAAYVYLGSASGLGASPSWIAAGDQVGAFFGVSVAGAGDVNGDGFADVVVGARLYSTGMTADARTDEGRAFLYLGSASGPSTAPSWSPYGDQNGAQFGFSVSGAGDVNGDGYADVAVGEIDYSGGEYQEGRVFLYFGSSTGLSQSSDWTTESNQAPASLGFSVASAGDVNGDGRDDMVAGAHRYPASQDLVGAAFLYLGGPAGNQPPTARAGSDSQTECSSPAGAAVTFDGSQSTDLDSTSGTNDDIVSYEWFESFGQPGQKLLATGPVVGVTLPLGTHPMTLRVTDRAGATGSDAVSVDVVDTRAPQITLLLTPALLWPPNHRLVEVQAVVSATDACGTPLVMLESVTSSEPDDAPGQDDGNTVGDVRGVVQGSTVRAFSLRAERGEQGGGRIYSVTYSSMDGSGNRATASAVLAVPHDDNGVTEPLMILPESTDSGTLIKWSRVPSALFYDVIRGNVAELREMDASPDASIDLGTVTCIARGMTDATTYGSEDRIDPARGQAFFYLVDYNNGSNSSFGTVSVAKPRVPGAAACQP